MRMGKLEQLVKSLCRDIFYSAGGFRVFYPQKKAKPVVRQGQKATRF